MEDTQIKMRERVSWSTAIIGSSDDFSIKLDLMPDRPPSNFELRFLDAKPAVLICTNIERTVRNRFTYWLLCRLFPFKVTNWQTGTNIKVKEDSQ